MSDLSSMYVVTNKRAGLRILGNVIVDPDNIVLVYQADGGKYKMIIKVPGGGVEIITVPYTVFVDLCDWIDENG